MEEKDIRAFEMANGLTYIGEYSTTLGGMLDNYIVIRTTTTGEAGKPLEKEYMNEYNKYVENRKETLSDRIRIYYSSVVGEIALTPQ